MAQRTFRTVSRGYDPQEVDRHLELVSGWFRTTNAAKALPEERERLAAAQESAERSLAGVRLKAEATLDAARRRAGANGQAAEQARAEAASVVLARVEAAAVLGQAHGERQRALVSHPEPAT